MPSQVSPQQKSSMSQTQRWQTRLSQPPPACSSQQAWPAGAVGVGVCVGWTIGVPADRRAVGERGGVMLSGRRVAVGRRFPGVIGDARGEGVVALTNPLLPLPQLTRTGSTQIASTRMGNVVRIRECDSIDRKFCPTLLRLLPSSPRVKINSANPGQLFAGGAIDSGGRIGRDCVAGATADRVTMQEAA